MIMQISMLKFCSPAWKMFLPEICFWVYKDRNGLGFVTKIGSPVGHAQGKRTPL